MVSLKKQCLSEFLCGVIVGFLGLGSLVLLTGLVGVKATQYEFSMLFGLAIAFTILIFNPVSGASFNPGVTLAMVLTKRQKAKTLLPYWGAQFAGWFVGAALVYGVFYAPIHNAIDSGTVSALEIARLTICNYQKGDLSAAIPMELILTALMVIIILACNDQRIINKPGKALFPLVLALYITFAVTFAGPFCGACFNAARDFGPRLFSAIWAATHGVSVTASNIFGPNCEFLVYLFVPTAGAVAGAFFYDGFIGWLLPPLSPEVKPAPKAVINENYIKKGSVIKTRKKKSK